MGGVGALPPAPDQQPPLPQAGKQLLQQPFRLVVGGQPGTELAEHRGVKPGVGKLQAQGVLPVDPAADRVGGLAVRQPLSNCSTDTSASRAGENAGRPRTPNSPANCPSSNSSPSASRTLIARQPFGNATRATCAVIDGTCGCRKVGRRC